MSSATYLTKQQIFRVGSCWVPPLDPRCGCLSTATCVGIQAHSSSALSRGKLSRTAHLSEHQAGCAAFVYDTTQRRRVAR